jgi:hypothetical protein
MQGEKHETSKEQGTNVNKKNKKQNTMQKKHKNHTLTRKKSLLGVFLFVVSLGGGATLNLKTLNPKPNFKLLIFPPRPRRTGFGFSCKNSYCSFVFFLKILIPILLVGSHMGENLKTGF